MIQNRTITVNSGQPEQLEVMVDRRHPEHPAAEPAERDHLDDHRQRLQHEQAAEDHAAAARVRRDRERTEESAERERTRCRP